MSARVLWFWGSVMSFVHNVIQMAETADQVRNRMLAEIEPLMAASGLRAVGIDILLAMFDRAGQKTAGGLDLPDNYNEDKIQGKIGLVLDVGPFCSAHPDFMRWFDGQPPKPGDWFGINTRDGLATVLKNYPIRMVEWKYLRFRIDRPDTVM